MNEKTGNPHNLLPWQWEQLFQMGNRGRLHLEMPRKCGKGKRSEELVAQLCDLRASAVDESTDGRD